MTTPKRPWPLWLIANLSMLLTIPVYEFWLTRVLRDQHEHQQSVSTAADSAGLPVDSLRSQVVWLLLTLNVLLWLALRSYPGRVPLWRGFRPSNWKTALIDGCAFLLLCVIALVVANSAMHGDWELGILGLPWLFLVFCLRAVFLERAMPSQARSVGWRNEVRGAS